MPRPTLHPDPTLEQLRRMEETANTTDVQVTMSDSPDPAVAGEELVYTLTVTNNGNRWAFYVRVVDTLPAGVSYLSDTGGCVEDTSGTLTCDLGILQDHQSSQVTITVLIDADMLLDGGGPITITNDVSVVNLEGLQNSLFPFGHIWPDPDPSNNRAAGWLEPGAANPQFDGSGGCLRSTPGTRISFSTGCYHFS